MKKYLLSGLAIFALLAFVAFCWRMFSIENRIATLGSPLGNNQGWLFYLSIIFLTSFVVHEIVYKKEGTKWLSLVLAVFALAYIMFSFILGPRAPEVIHKYQNEISERLIDGKSSALTKERSEPSGRNWVKLEAVWNQRNEDGTIQTGSFSDSIELEDSNGNICTVSHPIGIGRTYDVYNLNNGEWIRQDPEQKTVFTERIRYKLLALGVRKLIYRKTCS